MHQVSLPRSSQRGFTLIELLTAISIFSIMLLLVVGIFTRFMTSQRRDIGEQEVQEDLRLALELFNREARIGFGETFESNDTTVAFRNQRGTCVKYEWLNNSLSRAEDSTSTSLKCLYAATSWSAPEAIISGTTKITSLKWTTHPAVLAGDTLLNQGIITVSLTAQPSVASPKVVKLQSSVASRQTLPLTRANP